MENYIKAQQEILRVASLLKPGEVHIFCKQRHFVSASGNRLVDCLIDFDIHIEPIYDITTNPILWGRVIGRLENEIDNDSADVFTVVVGSLREYNEFALIFSKAMLADRQNFALGDTRTIWIPNKQEDTTNLPIIGSCQDADKPEQCPNLTQAGDSMGMLMAPIKKKDDLSAEFRKVTSDVMYANHFENYNIDADGIYQEISTAPLDDYEIDIRVTLKSYWTPKSNELAERVRRHRLGSVDIYLSKAEDAEPLHLQAVEKAIYLAVLLFEEPDGLVIEKLDFGKPSEKDFMTFLGTIDAIYNKLPNKRSSGNPNAFSKGKISSSTFKVYKKNIRDEIEKQIKNTRLAEQFAIEGPKGGLNRIAKSTPEIREKIRTVFGLN